MDLYPVLKTHEVVKVMRIAFEKAFECRFEFEDAEAFYVVFFHDGDDVLTLRVSGTDYWVFNCEKPEATNLFKLSHAMAHASALTKVLQLSARESWEGPSVPAGAS